MNYIYKYYIIINIFTYLDIYLYKMEKIILQINQNNKERPNSGLIYIPINDDNLPYIVIPKGYESFCQEMTQKLKDIEPSKVKLFSSRSRSSSRLRKLSLELPRLTIKETTPVAGKKSYSPKTPKTPEWRKTKKF